MKLKWWRQCMVLGGQLCLLGMMRAGNLNAKDLDSLLQLSIHYTIAQDYHTAERLGAQMVQQYPQHPAGYLFFAATLQAKMMDFETTQGETAFFANLDSTVRLAELQLRGQPRAAWAHFYLGSAFCYRAFYEGKRENYFTAYRLVTRGMTALRQALALDSTLADVDLGLGSFLFWKSQKMRRLTWLPFIEDERELGIALIQRSLEKGRFSRYAAMNSLAWIYIELQRYSEAIDLAQMGLQDYPSSRYFLWILAEASFRQGDFHAARAAYQKIVQSVVAAEFNNHYNEVIGHYKLAECDYRTGAFTSALAHCEAVENLKFAPPIRARLETKLKQLAHLKQRCQLRLAGLSLSELP
ncbi:tetratricopeptide repeat protein [candidate division KSB1 bacterium]|nr:tetratricopeptide repeat protein [candidate division KSB1 bacterium]